MAAVTSPARHAASLATSASNREPRRSKVHRAMEWPKPSSAPSSVITSASVRARMQTPSCTSYQLGSITTTRFTRTRHSDIVHPVSSSQLTEARDRVRSFGGYNSSKAHSESFGTELIQLTKRPSPKQFSSDFALQRELRGRLRETHGSSSVSTGSGPRDVLSRLRIARTTSAILISVMHLRSKSHEFQRQHGAHGSPLYRLMFPVYPDCQGASRPP